MKKVTKLKGKKAPPQSGYGDLSKSEADWYKRIYGEPRARGLESSNRKSKLKSSKRKKK